MQKPFIVLLQQLVGLGRAAFGTNSVICAGGAVRDTLNDAPVKDIDIFVGLETDDFEFADAACGGGDRILEDSKFSLCAKNFSGFARGRDFEIKTGNNPDYANLADFATFVVGEGALEGYRVEVVGLIDDPIADISDYDFGLSQCFVTPRSLHLTQACARDMLNCTITYNDVPRNPASLVRSFKRLQRLREKYPARIFIGAEVLEAQYNMLALTPEALL